MDSSSSRTTINYHHHNNSQQQPLSLGERMVCAGIAGVASWSIIFPLDAWKSRLYAATLYQPPKGVAAAAAAGGGGAPTSWASTSWMGSMTPSSSSFSSSISLVGTIRTWYRGFGITILRAGPVAAAVLPIYDTVLERLA